MSHADLTSTLREERELLRTLVTLVEEQRDCLIAGDAARVSDIAVSQAALLQKLSRTMPLALPGTTDSAPDTAIQIDEPDNPVTRHLQEEITILAARLQQQSLINRKLAEEAMQYIDFTVKLLLGQDDRPAYSSSGTRETCPVIHLMNRTA